MRLVLIFTQYNIDETYHYGEAQKQVEILCAI